VIKTRLLAESRNKNKPLTAVGTVGRLAVLAWSFALVMTVPPGGLFLAAGLALLVNISLCPPAVKRLLHWRWLFLTCLLIVPSMLWGGEADQAILGIPVSSTGFTSGLQMLVRAVVILLALSVFSAAVDITEVAGLLERIGLPGLGFSMGVAVNLLPALHRSSQNVWRSLRMRGGFRRQAWRGLQLLLVTVVVNALRRAEEIALAAEVRAFSPDKSRVMPLKIGAFDFYITFLLLICWLLLVLVF
jgi:energy-coupling factor transporter transmembrane protein EcfT